VVHLGEMRHLMGDDIVDDPLGRENQPPAERKIAPARAAAPAAPRIAHRDLRYVAADSGGKRTRPEGELVTRLRYQEIADAPREMHWLAAHTNLASNNCDRRRSGIGFSADPVRHPEYRHDGTLSEWHRERQRREAGRDPPTLALDKAHAMGRGHTRWQHQFDGTLGCVDAQRNPPRPRTDPNRNRRAQFESRRC